jgi:hypothetical protein
MARPHCTDKDLKQQMGEFRDRFPKYADDQLFVVWFLRAFVTEDEHEAADALCGGAGDKGVDAVLVDDSTKNIFIIQGKYRKGIAAKNEHRADVLSFAQLAVDLTGEADSFADLTRKMAPEVQHRLSEVRKRVLQRGYRLRLFYVTMGKCSSGIEDDAERLVRTAGGTATFQIFDGRHIMLLLSDYFDGVAPPVPSLDLEIEAGDGISGTGILQRYDRNTDIESWIFSMSGHAVAELYEHTGIRLFARNVRGFLGNTQINRGMENTFKKEPQYFWYYNNGITIICDDAKREGSRGKDILRVTNPQIINGQQTTRSISRAIGKNTSASVLIRVIRVSRGEDCNGNCHCFESLVSQIVSATNWQNAIRQSDLMSNDRRQIGIERQMRKLGYYYVRKRQTKGEARRAAGSQKYILVRKDEVAQAVAACDLDSSILREGKEGLFEERWYSHVFPTSDPYYYLTRYWLMRQVGYMARGYPERAYAKWLVLHFVWSHLSPLIRSRAASQTFVSEFERYRYRPFSLAIDAVFHAALRFYRRYRKGKGEKAPDVSTFFKRKGLDKAFAKFWKGSANKARPKFARNWAKFEKEFKEECNG